MPVGESEFVDNIEPRCPVILLLDTSGSISGQPIMELNAGLKTFKQEVEKDGLAALRVEVAIVTFGGSVATRQDFATVDQFSPPTLSTTGDTPMGEAIDYALDLLDDRKETYKNNGIQYYRPWVFLITDGGPTDGEKWKNAAQRVRQAESDKKVLFFAVGVKDANMNILSQIAPSERPPVLLNGLDFKRMFEWLSQSVRQVPRSKPGGEMVALPSAVWASNVAWGQITT